MYGGERGGGYGDTSQSNALWQCMVSHTEFWPERDIVTPGESDGLWGYMVPQMGVNGDTS